MNRPAPDYLDQITAAAELWRRRCNDKPAEGIPVSRRGLRIVLASSADVAADATGTISWSAAGLRFTAEPVRDEQ